MITIPSIDIYNGQVVRLVKGRLSDCTIYSSDPVEIVKWLEQLGARRIHIVDLSGAMGEGRQRPLLSAIARQTHLPLQLGGGIRNTEAVTDALNLGYSWVVCGTAAVKDPLFLQTLLTKHAEQTLLALDCTAKTIAVDGWRESTQLSIGAFLKTAQVPTSVPILVTDIGKDGMMEGPSLPLYETLHNATSHPLIASGGVRHLADLVSLKAIGVTGAIMGKALYNGSLTEKEITTCLQND